MPLYEYECPKCEEWTEGVFPVNARPEAVHCACGSMAEWRISAPAVHTLATFVADCSDRMVQKTHQSGVGYLDPNLGFDRKTGKHTLITSRKHREDLMKAQGLYEKEPCDMARDADSIKRRKPKSFSATGIRG